MQHAFEVHNMALEAVDKVVADPSLLSLFGIHENLWKGVQRSWNE